MVEPTTAAGAGAIKAISQAVTKKLTAKSGTRLGGRDERRLVYARFQSAMIEALSFAQHLRVENQFARRPFGDRRLRELAFMAHERQVEFMAAYFELRLVANRRPLEAGEAAMIAAADLLDSAVDPDDDAFRARIAEGFETQREFTDACRDDLWYQPRWWQAHRRVSIWWQDRRARKAPTQ
ncbi:hypothetical protein AB0J38_25870 [Streptomyces sp. NPDC050095]|uniref:hypothetical protein n=1 Tax=unclassified Streptomyces TaxID=2593676 RepID=UPI00341D8A57